MNSNSKGFRDFLFDAQLMDLGFKGPAYTWTNNQDTSTAVHQRLDLVVATGQWTQAFPLAYVNHLPRVHSDHAAILLRTVGRSDSKPSFKIENWWFNI